MDIKCRFNSGFWDGYGEMQRGNMSMLRNALGVPMDLHPDRVYAAGWLAGKMQLRYGYPTDTSDKAFNEYKKKSKS